ncbi:MAG TPA: type II toxin-antitoxin system VapB family antitoxin [Thermoanaerobaculia bacterium]|nr:type II toxin-antitoxin system VapB family antitoxin [Thermoanaerobaculia bacterium]
MRTNIEIDDELIREAIRLTDAQTKREVVHVALQELVRSRKKKSLAGLAGRVRLRDGYDHKSMRKLRNSGSR